MDAADDFSLYDDEEPTLPLMKKAKAYLKEQEPLPLFSHRDMENGEVVDAVVHRLSDASEDGIVTPDGALREFLEEIELYKEYHERRGQEIRAREALEVPEGMVTHVYKHAAETHGRVAA